MSVLSLFQQASVSLRQLGQLFGQSLGHHFSGNSSEMRSRIRLEKPTKANNGGDTRAGVYLLGAGPGDPELLTRKGERLLCAADVVLYDNLVSPQILALCQRRCQQIYVGKRAGQHAMTQPQINQLLVEYGKTSVSAHKVVVRLKGGDPAIFGRVTEEAAALEHAGIPFAIVPGITSACAASAYSGIALTARGQAAAVQFLTAQFADPSRQPDWQSYRYQQGQNPTLVVYMGLNRLNELSQGLINVGWPGDMPVALLDQVSTDSQQQLTGTLTDISARYARHQQGSQPLQGPTLIVIGLVVGTPMAVVPALLQVAENRASVG